MDEEMGIEETKEEIWRIEKKLKLSKSEFKRSHVERELSCDTDKLYGSLDTAIKYLQSVKKTHPQASLDEHWTGYEDMQMRFVWSEIETDDEHLSKLESILWERQRREAEFDRNVAAKEEQIKKLERELSALKKG